MIALKNFHEFNSPLFIQMGTILLSVELKNYILLIAKSTGGHIEHSDRKE
jgi:hypothetical protein